MTVTVSQIANTSSRRWEMKRIAAPCSRSVRTTVNSRSTSGPESAAVGSSMISTRASKLSALAISTICWSAIERPRTGRSESSLTPRRSSRPWTCACIARAVDALEAAERVVAHDDVLRDAQVREERRLLVDHRDAGVAGVVRASGSRPARRRRSISPPSRRTTPPSTLTSVDLPGAVLAHERAHLAGPQREVAVAQRAHGAVGLRRAATTRRAGRQLLAASGRSTWTLLPFRP